MGAKAKILALKSPGSSDLGEEAHYAGSYSLWRPQEDCNWHVSRYSHHHSNQRSFYCANNYLTIVNRFHGLFPRGPTIIWLCTNFIVIKWCELGTAVEYLKCPATHQWRENEIVVTWQWIYAYRWRGKLIYIAEVWANKANKGIREIWQGWWMALESNGVLSLAIKIHVCSPKFDWDGKSWQIWYMNLRIHGCVVKYELRKNNREAINQRAEHTGEPSGLPQ